MEKLYKVFNWQHQPVATFENLDAAKKHANELNLDYQEHFYVVEVTVVYKI